MRWGETHRLMQVIDSVLSLGLSGEFTFVHYILMAYNRHRAVTLNWYIMYTLSQLALVAYIGAYIFYL